MIGILGGMGPLATVDLMQKIILFTNASRDQDHVPIITYSDPTVPDRSAAIIDPSQTSPLPKMITGLQILERSGAKCIIIACNTAHHWISPLSAATQLPVIGIADAVCADLVRRAKLGTAVAVMATSGTIISGFYSRKLRENGFTPIFPSSEENINFIAPAITLVKRGEIASARPLIERALKAVKVRGADVALLACSELPLLLPAVESRPIACVDATECLAKAAIEWYFSRVG